MWNCLARRLRQNRQTRGYRHTARVEPRHRLGVSRVAGGYRDVGAQLAVATLALGQLRLTARGLAAALTQARTRGSSRSSSTRLASRMPKRAAARRRDEVGGLAALGDDLARKWRAFLTLFVRGALVLQLCRRGLGADIHQARESVATFELVLQWLLARRSGSP